MLLPGRLESTTLGDVLGTLYRARATGVLELVEARGSTAGRTHRVHLDRGLVLHVDSPLSVRRLGELLRREGFIDAATQRQLQRLLLSDPSRRAGELLVAEALASPDAVGAALRYQLRQRLDAVFSIHSAQLRFRVARRRPLDLNTEVPLSPEEFLAGRPRLRDVSPVPPRASGPRVCGARLSEDEVETAPPPPTGSGPRATTDTRRVAAGPSTRAPRRQDPVRTRALEALGLGPGADRGDVQRAFRQLASQCHPDRFPAATARERAELMRRFARLSSAYHALVA